MRVADIERLYDYSCWANHQLLTVVTTLSAEQFTQSVAGSYGSIRNTLVHVLSAEWGWLDRCGGLPRGERLKPENFATVEPLVEVGGRVQSGMREFLARLTDEDLQREVSFAFGSGPATTLPVGALLQHAVIHAVHHRGQVSLLLRMLGVTPGNFDLLVYAAAVPQTPA
jgi:uncharacterized damage-inducible protein DinB